MTSASYEDRPINPNKEYLQQKQLEYKSKKQHHQFLKKGQLTDKVLPCFRQNLNSQKKSHRQKSQSPQRQQTKAQIYEEIKRKNLQKFGEKQPNKKSEKQDQKKKKIDPLKMTINYKPKASIFIDTNEHKLTQQNLQQSPQNIPSTQKNLTPQHFHQTAKQKYQKLLTILHKQKLQLAKDKENFEIHRQKLQFKKMIEKDSSVPFIQEIKKNIQEKKKMDRKHREMCESRRKQDNQEDQTIRENKQGGNKLSKSSQRQKQNSKQVKYRQSLSQIQSRIQRLQQQKEEIEDDLYENKGEFFDVDDVVCKKYSILEVNQIPAFDIECFKDFIDLRSLHPHKNEFYQIALKVFQTGLTLKQAKIKLKAENLDQMKQNATQNTLMNSIDFKRRFQGPIRITKYNNGWTEVWTPGVQRLMSNKQLGYKVIWLKNGDIKQEWKDKKLDSYYSKSKEVVKVKFDKFLPIYFFVQLNQLEQYQPNNKIKMVMFKEGRVEAFSTEDDRMNGFAV